jgi:hypothetical protein
MKNTLSSRTAPQPSRDRKGAYVSPDFRLFFKGALLRPLETPEFPFNPQVG